MTCSCYHPSGEPNPQTSGGKSSYELGEKYFSPEYDFNQLFLIFEQSICDLEKGVVIKSTGSWYLVKPDEGEPVQCKLRGRLRLDESKSTNPVAVGDHVHFSYEKDTGTAVIEEISERRNYIIRRASNLSKQTQVLAANLDQAVLVATINYPVTTPVFIDRFLATAEAYSIPATLIFNKTDRYDVFHRQELAYLVSVYKDIGFDVLTLSAREDKEFSAVKELLRAKVTLLAGHSGVGKSTLINRLEPSLNLKTATISQAHGTGKHTTTFAEMHPLSFGGYIIDTPGIRGFGLFNIGKEELFHYFREIFRYSKDCQFHNCTHIHEPGCAVKKAVDDNLIAASRYNSYLSIYLNRDEKYRQ